MPTRYLLLGTLAVALACSSDSTGPDPRTYPEFVSLTAGGGTTCGVTADGDVYCWGIPIGDLPEAGREPACDDCVPSPTPLDLDAAVAELVVGTGWHFSGAACMLTTTRQLRCWGGMVGTVDIVYNLGDLPQAAGPGGQVAALAMGPNHICSAADDGQASCWGDYDYNVRGTGGPVDHEFDLVPTAVTGGHAFQALAAGYGQSCGLTDGGIVLCWGAPDLVGTTSADVQSGICGLPDECVNAPVEIQGGRTYTRLVANALHSCAVATGGSVYCWGRNHAGQLGDGSIENRVEPVLVPLPGAATALAAGWGHTCALVEDTIYCWGDNTRGQLGLGTTGAPVLEPEQVDIPASVLAVTAGGEHTCALDDTGLAWCWGANNRGQLGIPDLVDKPAPTPVFEP